MRPSKEGVVVYEIAERLGPIARELLTAWSRLPRDGVVPDRRSFDPMAITRILPVVSVIQREGEDRWRFRLVGTEIERRWGRVFTGMDCFAGVSPAAAAVMRRELRCIAEWPCGSRSWRRIELQSGRVAAIETLRLPLRGSDDTTSQILSCSGELGAKNLPAADPTREIIKIIEQEYFDIGAGCPLEGTVI
jgi:hypothetical protein